jgi:hypothetical protein
VSNNKGALLAEDAFELVSVVLAVVDLEVLLQVRARGELFVAGVAHVGLLPRVNALVPDQVRHLRERLVTALVLAPIRLLFVVHARMLLKRGILRERLVAQITILHKERWNRWGREKSECWLTT